MSHHDLITTAGWDALPVSVSYTHEPAIKTADPMLPDDDERFTIVEIMANFKTKEFAILNIINDECYSDLLKECEAHFRSL